MIYMDLFHGQKQVKVNKTIKADKLLNVYQFSYILAHFITIKLHRSIKLAKNILLKNNK